MYYTTGPMLLFSRAFSETITTIFSVKHLEAKMFKKHVKRYSLLLLSS
jgi:hypothetical protein